MHKDDFSMRLTAASYWAWRAMQRYVIDRLPPEFRYDLRLSNEPEKTDYNLRHWDVVDKVMKDDKVPMWIDMMVDRVENGKTVFSVECSDRYESDASKLCYTWSGSAPFGVKCGHFPKGWIASDLRGVPSRRKFRLCPTVWNRILDFLFLRWQFCRLDADLVENSRQLMGRHNSEHFFHVQTHMPFEGFFTIEVPPGIVESKALFEFYSQAFRLPIPSVQNWASLEECLRNPRLLDFTRVLIQHNDIPFANGSIEQEKYLNILLQAYCSHGGILVVSFPDKKLTQIDETLMAYWKRQHATVKSQVDVVNLILKSLRQRRSKF